MPLEPSQYCTSVGTTADVLGDRDRPADELARDSIGFVDALVIGLNSTSPAYSLAAVIGPIVALVGVYAPGVLLASFVPMLLIAAAFYFLNRVDPDCGTTFSWVTRAMGPWWGWQGGWAITMTGVLVIGALADVGVRFGLLTLGLDELADNKAVIMIGAVALILLMTAICVLGTELSARLQNVLIVFQVASLLIFAVVAISRVFAGDATAESISPRALLAQPVRCRRWCAQRRPAARRVRLLGLGVGGEPVRGDDRLDDLRPAGPPSSRPFSCSRRTCPWPSPSWRSWDLTS